MSHKEVANVKTEPPPRPRRSEPLRHQSCGRADALQPMYVNLVRGLFFGPEAQ